MDKTLTKKIQDWTETLTREQLMQAVRSLTYDAIMCETVKFWDEDEGPYWDSCGEPLVDSE